jgi:hypothetical protein
MYTELKMGIKRLLVSKNKLNLFKTELSRKKSVNIKNKRWKMNRKKKN